MLEVTWSTENSTERVYATKEDNEGRIMFLIHHCSEWKWIYASTCKPV